MRLPLCAYVAMALWFIYLVSGFLFYRRVRQHRIVPGLLTGWAPYRKELYTPEGQRLLAIFMKLWQWGAPLVLIAIGLFAGLLCKLLGEWSP